MSAEWPGGHFYRYAPASGGNGTVSFCTAFTRSAQLWIPMGGACRWLLNRPPIDRPKLHGGIDLGASSFLCEGLVSLITVLRRLLLLWTVAVRRRLLRHSAIWTMEVLKTGDEVRCPRCNDWHRIYVKRRAVAGVFQVFDLARLVPEVHRHHLVVHVFGFKSRARNSLQQKFNHGQAS